MEAHIGGAFYRMSAHVGPEIHGVKSSTDSQKEKVMENVASRPDD